jgi:negative regulator of flagellin synthesis FlgM
MKIDHSVKQLPGIAPVSEGQARPANGRASAPRASEADSVELSPLSARLQRLAQGIADTEGMDATKVAELKAAIAEGRLRIDPQAIADKLIEEARELLARSRS